MSRWFRVYDDLVDDPKVQMLSDENFRALMNLWCLTSVSNGALPHADVIAFKLRMPVRRVSKILDDLISCGLIDHDDSGVRPHNWDARQFKSDVSTGRVKQFRTRRRNADETFHETETKRPQITETETETEKKEKIEARTRAPQPKGSRLPPDWLPSESGIAYASTHGLDGSQDLREEIEKFRNFWHARAGREASKLDWDATWRNWILNWKKFNGNNRQANGRPKPTNYRELAESIIERSRAAGAGPTDAGLLPAGGGNVVGLLPPRRGG